MMTLGVLLQTHRITLTGRLDPTFALCPSLGTRRQSAAQLFKLMKSIDEQIKPVIRQWQSLFVALKEDIGDEYRASDDPEDDTPGMCVTIGFTPETEDKDASWSYQTGDNSYTGGAYGHPHWAVVSLYRRSNSRELAEDCADQIAELCAS